MFKRIIKEECKVPADVNYLGEMRDFVTQVGRKYGVAERIINAFKLAVDEAATNIIRHAYRDWEGFITMRMVVRDKSVTVSMIDQGHTFDLRKVKDPDLQRYVEIGKKGGLGIFIIRRVINDIDYRKTTEGNELRMTKEREVFPRRRFGIPKMGVTMKTRFSLIASGILTFLIIGWFIWNYIQQSEKILLENLEGGREIARSMARNALDHLAKEETWELARIAAEIQRSYAPLVVEALVVDTTGIIQGALRTNIILEPYEVPADAFRVAKNVYEYKMYEKKVVYDLVEEAVPEVSSVLRPIGYIHILLDKAVIEGEIAGARKRTVWMSGMVLVVGYMGIFVLVYMTMNPFKKLLKWVRAMGHDEGHDEMEFSASDEIGEIAQAFNEITEKFRKSQENLAEQERLQKEMQVAQEIQHTLLPAAFPEIEGYEIASHYQAAKEVGGDYFDFVEVDKDTLGIVVADVSGKGVPGSLVMTMIRTALRTEARGNKNAADVLSRVNDFVINDMKKGMFVTIFYIILDSQNRTISYASAGHNPMILYRGQTKKSYYLNSRGFPIGINLPDSTLFRKSIQSDTLQLREGDVLISYTDGVTEAMNPQRERFGDERFLSVIRRYGDHNVDPLVDKIKEDINYFTEGYDQSDDITLVAIREKMRAEDVLFNLRTRLMQLVNKEGVSVKEACRTVGVSMSTYYKYKKRFEKMGFEGLRETVIRSEIEEKHISIEDKAKLYDIIREHPEYGAKRINEELNSEMYGFAEIDEKRIYEELVRSRLNTKELRLAYVEKGRKGKRMKPPGTPFLTLDGQVIVDQKVEERTMIKERTATKEGEDSEKLPRDIQPLEKDRDEIGKQGETDILEPSELLDLNEVTERNIEKKTALDFDKIKEEARKEHRADQAIEEVFDELISNDIDVVDKVREDFSESDKSHLSLEQMAETDEGRSSVSGFKGSDQVEDQITASIAGELLEAEMGRTEDFQKDDRNSHEEKLSRMKKDVTKRLSLESGLLLYRQKLYSKAIEEFWKAIEEDPDFVEAYQCLGDTFFRLGQMDKAEEAYEKVRQLDPYNVNVLENLGVIFANRGDYKKAVWQWGEILKRNPGRRDIINRIKRMQRVIRQRSL